MLAYVLFRSWFSNMVSFRYVLVFFNFLHDISSIKFYTMSFLCKRNFFIDEKHTQWMFDTKIKYFMKVFHVSWNDPETVFHEMLWKKNFTVHPSLKNTFYYRTLLVAASDGWKETTHHSLQKPPPEVFCKKGVLRNFAKFTGRP